MRMSYPRRLYSGIEVLLFGVLVGCQTGHARMESLQPAAACLIAGDAPEATLTVAATHALDPAHAPVPHNPSERLLFRHLYDTLVQVDCEGHLLPGLAESWSSDADGRSWQFRLREDARFWDGTPVTAAEILRGWSANNASAARTTAAFAGLTAVGERKLRIELRVPLAHAHLFANPAFAVARPRAGTAWPVGSGPFRIETATAGQVRIAAAHARTTGLPTIEFRSLSSPDPRSALDAGIDLIITADAATLDYARALAEYTLTPLPWLRTYVLVTRTRGGADSTDLPAAEELRALARDAVRADTRVAQPPFWWDQPQCGWRPVPPVGPASGQAPGKSMVYLIGDPIARGIAERLVALAWPATRAPDWLRSLLPTDYPRLGAPAALGVNRNGLAESTLAFGILGLVVPLPRNEGNACAAPLLTDDLLSGARASATPVRITPLLDARDHLLHRGGVGSFVIHADGTLSFTGTTHR